MNEKGSILQELYDAVSRGSAESRLRALWHATDLLIEGRYTDDQVWIFGEVIERLADQIEVAARAQLAKRLACSDNAPVNILNKLAFDDSIAVAGPILRQSERLDVRALVANARSKSQLHLLAISKRKSLSHEVTDVLVARGNREVVSSVATNSGARFSEFGFLQMIKRSARDSILAEQLGLRKDIPRHLFHQLIAKASQEVRQKLQQERPDLADQVQTVVTDVTGTIHAKFGPASKSYFTAKRAVAALHRYGNLGEKEIWDYALSHKFEETTAALALLCNLPADIVERVLIDNNQEMMMIIAKSLGFSWTTTMALLFHAAPDHRISAQDLDDAKKEFDRLGIETTKDVLKFYRSRKELAAASSGRLRFSQRHSS